MLDHFQETNTALKPGSGLHARKRQATCRELHARLHGQARMKPIDILARSSIC
jgi:hypothetical protein